MITLTAKINLLQGNRRSSLGGSTEIPKNKISSDISNVIGSKHKTKNPFIFGASKFGEGATFESSVDYFIGAELSDESGKFPNDYVIQISGGGVEQFSIAFDTTNNRHPKEIVVDGNKYIDDDSIFLISGLDASKETHTIKIVDWNEPKYPLVISGIYVGIMIDIDYRALKNLEVKHTDRANNEQPSYGIISNSGTMTFIDSNGEIRDYAEQKLLVADLKVGVYLKDTINNTQNQVANFETSDWNYDTYNKEVQVQFKDNLEDLQAINLVYIDDKGVSHNGIPLARDENGIIIETKTAENLYTDLYNSTSQSFEKHTFVPFEQLDGNTKQILSGTKIKYYYMESDTLWNAWNKLCELVQAHIYQNFEGKTIFKVV